jgi:hypothetical protein
MEAPCPGSWPFIHGLAGCPGDAAQRLPASQHPQVLEGGDQGPVGTCRIVASGPECVIWILAAGLDAGDRAARRQGRGGELLLGQPRRPTQVTQAVAEGYLRCAQFIVHAITLPAAVRGFALWAS